ncbi:hypothetical protein HZS_6940, partial [Henneguya salminicola]
MSILAQYTAYYDYARVNINYMYQKLSHSTFVVYLIFTV